MGYDVYSEIINQHFDQDFAAQLTGKLATINNLSFDIIQEIINEAKAFPDLSVTELFEGFNLDRLDLDLGYADFKAFLKGPDGNFDLNVVDYIKSALEKLPYKLPKVTITGSLSRKMTLESIYAGEFNDRTEQFRLSIACGGENSNYWIHSSRTKVDKIDHKEVHLVLDSDLAPALRNLLTNTIHNVIDYEQYGEDYGYNEVYEEVDKVVDLEDEEIKLVIERPQVF